MSELRWDPLKASWVIISNKEGRRPADFIRERQQIHTSVCPFCYGQEGKTPPEVFAIRGKDSVENGQGWKVRVIPNKYPALRIEGNLDKRGVGLYDAMNGIGAHEVVIENPDHDRSMAEFSTEEIVDVLTAWRSRLLDLRKDPRFRYILAFRNHGIEAGAPIPHPHSQIIALPVTPPMRATELSTCRKYFERKERCLVCDILTQEREDGRRIVSDDGNYLVFAPFASRFPFELNLLPWRHSHDFTLLADNDLADLAKTLKDTLLRLHQVLHDPPYNLALHNSPPMHLRLGKPSYWGSIPYDYHWHIEIVPRLGAGAGFELGTGLHMNPAPPEIAARFLREADPLLFR